jgi:hypothetical protein
VLVGHRLILSRLLRSLFNHSLANLVGVAYGFLEPEAILAESAMLHRWRSPANIAMPLSDRLGHHLDDRPWRLSLSSVDLSKVFDPGQVPLGSSRDFLRVPQ